MESIEFFNPRLYSDVNTIIVFIMCVIAYLNYSGMDNRTLLRSNERSLPIVQGYMLIFILVIGLRPLMGHFGDMRAYSWSFERVINEPSLSQVASSNDEWIWAGYSYILGNFGGIHLIFFTTTALYVLLQYIAIRRFFKYRRDIALLFLFGFFSFFSYATNTIRAGLAMSVVILALSFLIHLDLKKPKDLIIGLLLCFIAFGIHRSSLLTITSFILAMTILRNCKINTALWIICIGLSLLIGSGMQELIMDMLMSSDFQDQRVEEYFGREASGSKFLRTGFRWDFILYSSLPILVGLYVSYQTKTKDKAYFLLLNTYIIANMFWVLINRAAFSDRFAYLSWCLYPIVVAYPFLRINIKENQGALMSKLLLIVSGFTLLMNIAYYD